MRVASALGSPRLWSWCGTSATLRSSLPAGCSQTTSDMHTLICHELNDGNLLHLHPQRHRFLSSGDPICHRLARMGATRWTLSQNRKRHTTQLVLALNLSESRIQLQERRKLDWRHFKTEKPRKHHQASHGPRLACSPTLEGLNQAHWPSLRSIPPSKAPPSSCSLPTVSVVRALRYIRIRLASASALL